MPHASSSSQSRTAAYGSKWQWQEIEELALASEDGHLRARIFPEPHGTWAINVLTTGWVDKKDAHNALKLVVFILCDMHGYCLRHDEFNWDALGQLGTQGSLTTNEPSRNGKRPQRPRMVDPGMPRVPFDNAFQFIKAEEVLFTSACGTLTGRILQLHEGTFNLEIESRQWRNPEEARDVFRMLAIPLLDNDARFHDYRYFDESVVNYFGGGRLRANMKQSNMLLGVAREMGLEPDDYEDIEEEDIDDDYE